MSPRPKVRSSDGPVIATGNNVDSAAAAGMPLSRAMLAGYSLALCVGALGYALFTQHIWEDALITLRPAENLLAGHGLTYNIGTRVQTFTSPVNILLLIVSSAVAGKGAYVAALWFYRIFTIAAFAGSGVLLLQAVATATPRWTVSLVWLAIIYLFDAKSVAFSTNGMETGFMLLFVAWAVYLLAQPRQAHWSTRGMCWAGLMWTRPDSCVYIGALAAAELIFGGFERKKLWQSLVKSGAVCAALYGPWVIWAWWYYGSPIPNTILAKADAAGVGAQFWHLMDSFSDTYFAITSYAFRQFYPQLGGFFDTIAWERLLNGTTKCLGILCAIYWLFPVNDRLGRMASFCFAAVCCYFGFQKFTYPWYLPPATLFGFVTLERFAATLVAGRVRFRRKSLVYATSVAVLVLLAFGQVAMFALTSWEMKVQQAEIELGTRAQIGKWLHENGKPTDTVYLEPLGYIGYFAEMVMHDYPGLASPTVVKVRNAKQLTFIGMIPELKPDWVVLRPHEYQAILQSPIGESFKEDYLLKHEFNTQPRLEEYSVLPGKAYITFDSAFGVFQRRPPPTF